MKRLEKAANYRRMTKQDFVEQLVMAEIAAIEQQRGIVAPSSPTAANRQSENLTLEEPAGLGIADMFRRRQEETVATITEAAQKETQSSVVVNVGSTSSAASSASKDDVIEFLASYVLNGYEFEKHHRLHKAVSMLRGSATTDEERKVLAARLDEAIAAKTKKVESQNLLDSARLTINRIKDLIGGP